MADVQELDVSEGRSLYSRVAGVFLFLPFLLEAGLEAIVAEAKMAGSKMIPPVSYVLSLLALKLLDKERKSHISDTPRTRRAGAWRSGSAGAAGWSFDEALGWFAGLNVLPKTTATADYTYPPCRSPR